MNVLDLLFPKRCAGCGRLGRYFCARCSSIIRIIELNEAICPVCEKPAIDGATHPRCQTRYALDGLTSFFRYDGIIRKAVKALKYRFVSDLAQEFIGLIPPSALDNLTMQQFNNCVFIPIPLHPSRLRHRGFNQAEALGRFFAEKIRISLKTDILRRVRKTIPQVEMKNRKERLKNMDKVFAVKDITIQQYKNSVIILFDDVFTTGATLREAANALKRAGAKFVWGVTMAR